METYDVSGLSQTAAREYIKDILVHLKTLEMAVATKKQELDLWESRIKLAETSQREDLKSGAQMQSTRIKSEIALVETEVQEVINGLAIMKEQLTSPAFASAEIRDSADSLLSELQDITGPKDNVTPILDDLDIDASLEEMKKNLR